MKMRNKKVLVAIVAVVLAIVHCFVVVGCVGKQGDETTGTDFVITTKSGDQDTTSVTTDKTETDETTSTEVIHTGDYVDLLTGYPCEKDLSSTRPVAVVVDNSSLALKHQSGLGEAAIVYEGLVAPGITRFLAVYSDYESVPYICNVRSARKFTIDWAQSHNAILVCHGGPSSKNSPYDISELLVERYGDPALIINTLTEYWFATAEGGDMYNTIRHKGDRADLLYDTCITKEALVKALTNTSSSKFVKAGGKVEGKVLESIKHYSKNSTSPATVGNQDATYVKLKFTAEGTQTSMLVEYDYDEVSQTYKRSQEGVAHKDAETGKQLSFKNLLVIVTDVDVVSSGVASDPYMTDIRTTGSGTAYYFTNGKVLKCFWSKNSASSELSVVDSQGKDVIFSQGNTYIGYVDTSFEGTDGFYR